MTSFQLVKTRGVAKCFLIFSRFKWRQKKFLSQYGDTKAIFYLYFHIITKGFFSSFRYVIHVSVLQYKMKMTSAVSLYSERRDDEARPIRACAGRLLLHKNFGNVRKIQVDYSR